jgi:hypothetical protein
MVVRRSLLIQPPLSGGFQAVVDTYGDDLWTEADVEDSQMRWSAFTPMRRINLCHFCTMFSRVKT